MPDLHLVWARSLVLLSKIKEKKHLKKVVKKKKVEKYIKTMFYTDCEHHVIVGCLIIITMYETPSQPCTGA